MLPRTESQYLLALHMTFYSFGLNHETAPLSIREAFALTEADARTLYRGLTLSAGAELMVLSTCNRTEAYLYGTSADVAAVQHALGDQAGHPWPAQAAFLYEDEQAVRHLFQVTAGIKSLVLGDAQILVQVKEAYRLAVGEEYVGTILHRLLHTAFRTAKRVIHETSLTHGMASIPSAAVAAARAFFEETTGRDLAELHVLVVGAGRMGRLVLEALAPHEAAPLMVTNRTYERAQTLATAYGAAVVAWEDRYQAVQEADVVFVASGAQAPVLERAELVAPEGFSHKTLLLDIAVPRNVETAIDALPAYTVIDLDALDVDLVRIEAQRREAVPAALSLCEEALSEFVAWVFHQQALQPAIHALHDTFERIRLQEIERHHRRFTEVDRAELDRLTTSIIQKLLAVPVVRLKSVDPDSIDFTRGIRLLQTLFSRPDCEDESASSVASEYDDGVEASPEGRGEPIESPAQCPFDDDVPVEEDSTPTYQEALREALRIPPTKQT